jgi:hypothetical protein
MDTGGDASDEDVRESYTEMGQHWLECAERASSQQSSVASAMTRRQIGLSKRFAQKRETSAVSRAAR